MPSSLGQLAAYGTTFQQHFYLNSQEQETRQLKQEIDHQTRFNSLLKIYLYI